MRFTEIINRLNGVSCPVFGVSWTPPVLDVTEARAVISFLEDRRVLYNPSAWESPDHCVSSVLEIRRFITGKVGTLPPSSDLLPHLKAIRSACRKFMDTMQQHDGAKIIRLHYYGEKFGFYSALGELRGAIGPHVATLAVQYGIDIEEELASVLPIPDDPSKK